MLEAVGVLVGTQQWEDLREGRAPVQARVAPGGRLRSVPSEAGGTGRRGHSTCLRLVSAPENDSKLVGLSGQLVDMACKVCQAYLGQLEHEDIDVAKDAITDLTEEQWKELTQQYYALIQ